jgi:uncharacterized protein (TIGR03067 family)
MLCKRDLMPSCALVALVVAAFCVNSPAQAQEKLYGTWKVEFFARRTIPGDAAASEDAATPSRLEDQMEIVIGPNKIVLVWGASKADCKLELVAKDPNSGQMTITFTSKGGPEEMLLGIYSIKDGVLSLCVNYDNKKPTNFEIKYNEEKILMRLRKK